MIVTYSNSQKLQQHALRKIVPHKYFTPFDIHSTSIESIKTENAKESSLDCWYLEGLFQDSHGVVLLYKIAQTNNVNDGKFACRSIEYGVFYTSYIRSSRGVHNDKIRKSYRLGIDRGQNFNACRKLVLGRQATQSQKNLCTLSHSRCTLCTTTDNSFVVCF